MSHKKKQVSRNGAGSDPPSNTIPSINDGTSSSSSTSTNPTLSPTSTSSSSNEFKFGTPFPIHSIQLFGIKIDSLGDAPKLKGNSSLDYEEWKKLFMHWGTSKGVWRFINSNSSKSYADACDYLSNYKLNSAQIRGLYSSLHERLWGCICVSIFDALGSTIPDAISYEQQQQELYYSFNTGNVVFLEFNCNYLWVKIKDTFEKKAGSATIQCFEELINLRLEEKENPLQFRQRFDSIIHRWNNIENDEIKPGQKISEGAKFALLTRSLPKRYDTVVQAVLTTQTTPAVDHIFTALQRQYENTFVNRQRIGGKDTALNSTESMGNNNNNNVNNKQNHHNKKTHFRGKDKYNKGNKFYNSNSNGHQNKQDKGDKHISNESISFGLINVTTNDIIAIDQHDRQHGLTITDQSQPSYFSSPSSFVHISPPVSTPSSTDTTLVSQESRSGYFIFDSGSTRHITFDKNILVNLKEVEPFYMWDAHGHKSTIKYMGSLPLNDTICIHNVCYAPNMSYNLLSLSSLLDNGSFVDKIDKKEIVIKKKIHTREKTINVSLHFSRATGSGLYRFKVPEKHRQNTHASKAAYGVIRQTEEKKDTGRIGADAAIRGSIPLNASATAHNSAAYLNDKETALLSINHVDSALTFYPEETNLAKLWHNRLGHLGINVITTMNQTHSLGMTKEQLKSLANCVCDSCIYGKGRAKVIHKYIDPQYKPQANLQMLYMDLIGWISSWDGARMNRVPTVGGNLYALNVVDGHSTVGQIKLLKFKSDAADSAITLIKQWESATNLSVREIHTDGGGEFINAYFKQFLDEKGIKLTFTTRDHPEHNGVVERRNGILKEMVRAMLAHSCVPTSLWGEALNYATFIYNNSSQPSIKNQIPNQLLFNQVCSLNKFKVFGCDAYVMIDEDKRGAFDPRFKKGLFVGADEVQNCYRIMDPDTKRIIKSRDVKFIESSFSIAKLLNGDRTKSYELNIIHPVVITNNPIQSSVIKESILPIQSNTTSSNPIISTSDTELKLDDDGVQFDDYEPSIISNDIRLDDHKESIDDEKVELKEPEVIAVPSPVSPVPRPPPPPSISYKPPGLNTLTYSSDTHSGKITETLPTVTRYGRTVNPTQTHRLHLLLDENDELYNSETALTVQSNNNILNVPNTYKQAINSKDSAKWIEAMKEEMLAHSINGTWKDIGNTKPEHEPISARWVYAIKMDQNNKPTRYKARLVARGFEQQPGIDFDETFAPVTKFKSIKLLLTIAANQDLEIKQLDFDTAFLNAKLEHKIYLDLPEGTGYHDQIVQLVKSLYGLRQAGHDWHKLIAGKLESLGYIKCKADKCLFYKSTATDRKIYIGLHVDDTFIVYDKQDENIWLKDKSSIATSFKIKDIGDCNWFLNMELKRDRVKGYITLSQSAYLKKILIRFGLENCKPVSYPTVSYDLFNPPSTSNLDHTLLTHKEQNYFQQIIGSLNYAAMITRPDIAYAVNELSRFNAQAKRYHMDAAKHVLRYIAGTLNLGLRFEKNKQPYSIQVYTDASWANDLETRRSTTGVLINFKGNPTIWLSKKQKTVAKSSTEAEYVAAAESVSESLWLNMWFQEIMGHSIPITLLCDNQSALAIAKDDKEHQRTKHIDVAHHFVREQVENGTIKLQYVPTEDQDADILTKHINTISKFKAVRDRVISTV